LLGSIVDGPTVACTTPRMQARALLAVLALSALVPACAVTPTLEEEGASSQALAHDGLEPGGDGEPAITRAELAEAEQRVEGFEDVPEMTNAEKQAVLERYASVPHAGIRTSLYEKAILYYDHNLARIPNKRWLAVLDFAKHSKHKRYYLMDMEG